MSSPSLSPLASADNKGLLGQSAEQVDTTTEGKRAEKRKMRWKTLGSEFRSLRKASVISKGIWDMFISLRT